MMHFWAWLHLWSITKFLKDSGVNHIYRNNQARYSSSPIANIMGNISTSFTTSSPRTICHRTLSWAARRLGLRDFEISDNIRDQIRTTIVLDRANFPADALRQRLRERLEEDPGTMAVSWNSRGGIATALAMSVQRV